LGLGGKSGPLAGDLPSFGGRWQRCLETSAIFLKSFIPLITTCKVFKENLTWVKRCNFDDMLPLFSNYKTHS
jgi:hypothetical protein